MEVKIKNEAKRSKDQTDKQELWSVEARAQARKLVTLTTKQST